MVGICVFQRYQIRYLIFLDGKSGLNSIHHDENFDNSAFCYPLFP